MELYPGTSIPLDRKICMDCDVTYEKIRSSISDVLGTSYEAEEYSAVPEVVKKAVSTFNQFYTKKMKPQTKRGGNKRKKKSKERERQMRKTRKR